MSNGKLVPVIVEVTQTYLVYEDEHDAQRHVHTQDSGDWDLHKRGDCIDSSYSIRYPDDMDHSLIVDWEAHDEVGPRTPEGHFHSEVVRARWAAENEARVAALAVKRAGGT